MVIEKAAYAFRCNGTPVSCHEFGHGHINTTMMVHTDAGKSYVMQKINKYVFKEPEKVMENASAVTNHVRKHSREPYAALHYMTTHDGAYYHLDENGEYWRMYEFVPGVGLEAPECDEDLYQCASAFGRFQEMLSDFPSHTLHETIPNFHNTVDRYRQLKESAKADPVGRAASVQQELKLLMAHEQIAGTLQRMLEAGELPLRVTHNDTKFNNVLLDQQTHKCLCILDLDTVMPGLSLHDFGDAIRSGASVGGENETDPTQIYLDLHLFEVYTRGYLEAATSLTDKEIDNLPLSALVITLELATRFLKDYLDGDLYFKIDYPEHNLTRARSQIFLAIDMERKLPEMNRIVAQLRRKSCNT